MANLAPSWVKQQITNSLSSPKQGLLGRITNYMLQKNNSYLEENAVRLCEINPDFHVLEIGFGPGIGLQEAYKKIKDGKGIVYGIDRSHYMFESAKANFKKEIKKNKMLLFRGCASSLPLNTDTIHRVFHCNCHFFWPNNRVVMREIFRVMRPGGVMVTTINLNRIKQLKDTGFLEGCNLDPVVYMTSLESYGFSNVNIKYLTDPKTKLSFQAIFAEVKEKPAHDSDWITDEDTDEEINQMDEKLQELLREKENKR